MRRLILAAVIASALVAGAGVSAQPAVRLCGSITVRQRGNDYSYRIKVFVAPLACSTAQKMMSTFIMRGVVPRRWFCRFGHSADRWAASCAGPQRTSPLVRAYLIAG